MTDARPVTDARSATDGKPRHLPPQPGAFDPTAPDLGHQVATRTDGPRYFRRGPWEMGASIVIALGVFMLMQPFSIALYGWSFLVTLVGTVGFIVVSHFPE